MAQVMQEKNPVQSTTEMMIPTRITSDAVSTLFMKRMIAIAISHITYLRSLFPENCFENRQLFGQQVKILSLESNNSGVGHVIDWIGGCYEAIEKKYLRQIMLGIFHDENKPDDVTEAYSFKFNYTNTDTEITCNNEKLVNIPKNGSEKGEETLKKSVQELIKTCIFLTENLKPLPIAFMTMKILYYDERTPADYEPPGFMSSNCDTFFYEGKPMNIALGAIKTNYHSLKMTIKTNDGIFPNARSEGDSPKLSSLENDEITQTIESKSIDNKKSDRKDTENIEIITILDENDTFNGNKDENKTPNSNVERSESKIVEEEEMDEHDSSNDVHCPCLDDENDGLMILCNGCEKWQHAACYGVLKEKDSPSFHICVYCVDPNDPKKKGTCPEFSKLSESKLRSLCLLKRCLIFCNENECVSVTQLEKYLEIDKDLANSLFDKLMLEGFLLPQKKSTTYRGAPVNLENIKRIAFKKYFRKFNKNEDIEKVKINEEDEKTDKMELLSRKTNALSIEKNQRSEYLQIPDQNNSQHKSTIVETPFEEHPKKISSKKKEIPFSQNSKNSQKKRNVVAKSLKKSSRQEKPENNLDENKKIVNVKPTKKSAQRLEEEKEEEKEEKRNIEKENKKRSITELSEYSQHSNATQKRRKASSNKKNISV